MMPSTTAPTTRISQPHRPTSNVKSIGLLLLRTTPRRPAVRVLGEVAVTDAGGTLPLGPIDTHRKAMAARVEADLDVFADGVVGGHGDAEQLAQRRPRAHAAAGGQLAAFPPC